MIDDFLLALGTLSRIKVPRINRINYQKSTLYFPVVGYLAGIILFFSDQLLILVFSETISKLIALLIYYMLFGFFHFDGLLDCIDGFFPSHKSKADRLRIMKDSNTGAFALLFGVLFLIVEIYCVVNSTEYWYFFPVFGRISPLFLLSFSKPAANNGLGMLYFPYPKYYSVSSIILTIPIFFHSPLVYFWLLGVIIVSFIIIKISNAKIEGITGDVLGLSIMLSELSYLIYLNTKLFFK